MHQTIKNILGGVIAVAVLAFGYAAMSYVSSYGKSIQPSSFRSFSVTGDGKVTAIPDVAEFSFQVITEGGKDVASLQAKNTDAANKAIAFVKSKGVEDKDIKTQYYNVDPRYQTYNCRSIPITYDPSGAATSDVQPCPPASIVGYTITQSVDVKVRDFSKIGDIMGGVVTNGANQIGSLSFTVDDPTKVQDEARADAIAKAKVRAELVAQAGGFKLGRLLGIQDDSGYRNLSYDSYAVGMGGGAMKSAAAPSPVVEPGSQEVNVSVTLQYEIQ
jgi:uncharacterized protein